MSAALKALGFFLRIALPLLIQKLVHGLANQLTLGRLTQFTEQFRVAI